MSGLLSSGEADAPSQLRRSLPDPQRPLTNDSSMDCRLSRVAKRWHCNLLAIAEAILWFDSRSTLAAARVLAESDAKTGLVFKELRSL